MIVPRNILFNLSWLVFKKHRTKTNSAFTRAINNRRRPRRSGSDVMGCELSPWCTSLARNVAEMRMSDCLLDRDAGLTRLTVTRWRTCCPGSEMCNSLQPEASCPPWRSWWAGRCEGWGGGGRDPRRKCLISRNDYAWSREGTLQLDQPLCHGWMDGRTIVGSSQAPQTYNLTLELTDTGKMLLLLVFSPDIWHSRRKHQLTHWLTLPRVQRDVHG